MSSGGQLQKRSSSEAATTKVVVDTGKHGWWSALPDGTKRVVATFAAIAGMSLIAYLGFLYARKVVRDKRAKDEQGKAFGKDKHATWATQIHQAVAGAGTDELLIRQTLRAIPSKEDFNKVVKSYAKQFSQASLVQDLQGDLSNYEYQEMMAIVKAKPEKAKDAKGFKLYDPDGWAKRINAAVNYTYMGFWPGTDLEAIKAVFAEIPSRNAFYATAKAYRKLYHVSIWVDLDGDLDWSWDWKAQLKKKPAN